MGSFSTQIPMSEYLEPGGTPWMCPSCGRRVPRRVAQCRCGYEVAPANATSNSEVGASSPARVRVWVIVAPTLVVLGAAIGVFLSWSSASPPSTAVAQRPSSTEPLGPDEGHASGDVSDSRPLPMAWPVDLAQDLAAIPTAAPVAPAAMPALSLEEIVNRASAAVVSLETPDGRGTGFFVAPDRILTNAHVVGSSVTVTVRFADGRTMPARIERTAPEVDLAIVRPLTPAPDQPIVPLGTVKEARAGQEVITIGSALGVLQHTVTRGIVSAVRNINGVVLVQTDAAINPGNSGGPLLDRSGRAIGITTLKINADALGFAVAIDHARPLLEGRPAGRVPVAPGAGTSHPLAAAFAGAPSQADALRVAGEARFEQITQALARRADQIDEYWGRFRNTCNPGPPGGAGDRDWFGIWDQRPALPAPDPQCMAWLGEAVEHGRDFSRLMREADEAARTANVYPGTRRDVRRKYRLDWAGWER